MINFDVKATSKELEEQPIRALNCWWDMQDSDYKPHWLLVSCCYRYLFMAISVDADYPTFVSLRGFFDLDPVKHSSLASCLTSKVDWDFKANQSSWEHSMLGYDRLELCLNQPETLAAHHFGCSINCYPKFCWLSCSLLMLELLYLSFWFADYLKI